METFRQIYKRETSKTTKYPMRSVLLDIDKEDFWGESEMDLVNNLQKRLNDYYSFWITTRGLYPVRKITLLDKIIYFIFKWKMRFGNAWNSLRGKDNW